MYAEELCFAPKYVRLKQLVDEGALGNGPPGQAVARSTTARTRPGSGTSTAPAAACSMDMGCHADRVLPLDARPAGDRGRCTAQMGTYVHGDKTRGDDDAILHRSSSKAARSGWPRRAGPSPAAWTTAPRSTAPRAWPTPTCCAATSLDHLQRRRLRLRRREGRTTAGWTFTIFEEMLELRLPAGDGALRRAASRGRGPPRDRRRRPRGPGDHLRRLPRRRPRPGRPPAPAHRRGGRPAAIRAAGHARSYFFITLPRAKQVRSRSTLTCAGGSDPRAGGGGSAGFVRGKANWQAAHRVDPGRRAEDGLAVGLQVAHAGGQKRERFDDLGPGQVRACAKCAPKPKVTTCAPPRSAMMSKRPGSAYVSGSRFAVAAQTNRTVLTGKTIPPSSSSSRTSLAVNGTIGSKRSTSWQACSARAGSSPSRPHWSG